MQKAKRYAIILVGFTVGVVLGPYLLFLLFVAVAFVMGQTDLRS